MPKNANEYFCEKCDFRCSKKSNYEKHLLTLKHQNTTITAKSQPQHICECGKVFSHRGTLWNHKNKHCQILKKNADMDSSLGNPSNVNDEASALKQMLIEQQESHFKQLKEQQEQMNKQMLQQQEQIQEQQEQHNKQIQDLIPQLQQVTNINNSNNTNCNNKFNLNFFLNEQCKDAISIQHFIENLNIGIRELEHMGDVGYVKGMMSIFSETLGAMDIYKRPLHCTDLKRDTLYIKQGDTWTKDTEDKTELKKIVETVKCRNYGSLRLWEREHPEAFECDTQDNIDYMRISSESLGGFNSTDTIKLNKIIKHVVKEVYVK